MMPTSPGDHDLNTMLLHHEDNGIIAREEEPQVTLTKTPAQKAWPILQLYLGECRQAGLDQAASHLQKCIKIHMMTKWAQEATVEVPRVEYTIFFFCVSDCVSVNARGSVRGSV